MPMLNINELQKTIQNKRQNRIKCYEIILAQIHKKIINCSKLENSFCVFAIPEYIIGLPILNNKDCTEFLIDNLTKNGFLVNYTFPNLIYISWDTNDTQNKNNINNNSNNSSFRINNNTKPKLLTFN